MSDTPAVARLAATVLLLRDGPAGLEVFMVERHYAIDFASGALVFPGGRVDAADAAFGDDPAKVLRVAAIRETFEECGILLARPRGTARLVNAAELAGIDARHRARLNKAETTLPAIAAAEGLDLADDLLVPWAHWITPANQAKRYDTHFFLAVAPTDQVGLHDGHESVDSVWITPAAALAGVEAGTYKMVFATHLNLVKLARSATVADAIAAARAAPVVTVQPIPLKHDGGKRLLRLPVEAGYGGPDFEVDLPPAMP
jgi:8-oxo-dGTP pyrophosphatase MutT (NUDIX family)